MSKELLQDFNDSNPRGKIILMPLQAMLSQPDPKLNWKGGLCGSCKKPIWIAPAHQRVLNKGAIGRCPVCGYREAGLRK